MTPRVHAQVRLISKLVFISGLAMLTAPAGNAQNAGGGSVFRNTDPGVAYVGSASCAASGCHAQTHRNYFATPHGKSMAAANSPAELARAPKPVTVFNPKNRRYYTVYQDGANLYQGAYELDKNGRKIYSITHKLDYVSGGERTGYTYLFRAGQWIFQAPLSFYTASKTWELSPGYDLDDVGFTRLMTTSCLMCHNAQPQPEPKREGMYKEQPFRFGELAIGCEGCHGPGELHVREMQTKKGRTLQVDEVDTSIVNPAKLPPHLANDICRECHQQADAVVLMPGKSYLDYRPGMPLADTMALVQRPLREDQRAEANRLEANPPVRGSLEQPLSWKNSALELSKCYQASHGRLTCGTCHSIHHAASPADEKVAYRAACLTCHTETSCTLKPDNSTRVAAGDYCVSCHMEERQVAGIAHSSGIKHRIVRFPGQPLPEVAFEQPKPDLPGLLWTNRPAGAQMPEITQLEAYFTVAAKDPSLWPYWFKALDKLSRTKPDDPLVLDSLGAVALAEKRDNAKAVEDFSRALKFGMEDPTTFLNLAAALEKLGRGNEAEEVLERGVAAYPYSGSLTAQLAEQCFVDGKAWRARGVLARYRAFFPENEAVRLVEKQMDRAGAAQTNPGQGAPVALPR